MSTRANIFVGTAGQDIDATHSGDGDLVVLRTIVHRTTHAALNGGVQNVGVSTDRTVL